MIALIIYMAVMTLPIGLVLGFIYGNKVFYAKTMRKITKKQYGIIRLVGFGKNIITLVKKIDKDMVEINGIKYYIEDTFFYSEKDVSKKVKINDNNIYFDGGVPCIYLDPEDLIPLTFSNVEMDGEFKSRLATQVTATLAKEQATAEQEAMQLQNNGMNKTLKQILIFAVLSMMASCVVLCRMFGVM